MNTLTSSNVQAVLDHHLAAFSAGDVVEILKDYTEDSELLTPDGSMKGLEAIAAFFSEVFKIIPKGTALALKQMLVRENLAYIAWSCESSFVSIPLGTDSFVIQSDKIQYQTLAAHIIGK